MIYLLDASVLITAKNTYYSFSAVPEFWQWLIHMGENNKTKLVRDIYEELKDGNDDLADWVKKAHVEDALLYPKDADIFQVRNVLSAGYANDLRDDEIDKLGRDPLLISYGLSDTRNITIVTTEVSKPKLQRANRRIPDVCEGLGVKCINTFEFTQILGFSTNWKAAAQAKSVEARTRSH